MLLFASVERFGVSCMRDFFFNIIKYIAFLMCPKDISNLLKCYIFLNSYILLLFIETFKHIFCFSLDTRSNCAQQIQKVEEVSLKIEIAYVSQ